MTVTSNPLDELQTRLEQGEPFGEADTRALLEATDLVRIGMIGESARRRRTGDTVTFCRVLRIERGPLPDSRGSAGEVRIVGTPTSADEAVGVVRAAARLAEGVPLTGFDAADLASLCGQDHLMLADLAAALKAEGLDGIAGVPVDRLGAVDVAAEVVRAIRHGGVAATRLIVHAAPEGDRLALVNSAQRLQEECGGFEAFSPLPLQDSVEEPSTGYDDVKTVTLARLICSGIERIQMDWPIYGPKLAQVAIAFGANDIDGVAAIEDPALGRRRAPLEEIRRQIRAASATPVERDGLYRVRE
jgi:hypothetical protein